MMFDLPTDPRILVMLFGLTIAGIGAFGFAIVRTMIGTRMTKAHHPDLFIEGIELMKRSEKKRHYNSVTRKAAMAAQGKYFFWMAILGFALLWGAALYPIFAAMGKS